MKKWLTTVLFIVPIAASAYNSHGKGQDLATTLISPIA